MSNIPSLKVMRSTVSISVMLLLSFYSAAKSLVSFNELQQEILGPKCGVCHITQMDTPENSIKYLSNAKATNGLGTSIMVPGDAENSYLYMKVSNDPRIIGSKMPLDRPSLSSNELVLIKSWINSGAKF